MSVAFSTDDRAVIERKAEVSCSPTRTPPDSLLSVYELSRCKQWIETNKLSRVCNHNQ